MSILAVGLEPDYAKCADQTEQGADLKLPLANHDALFGKKYQRKKSGEDDGRANEDRVNTWTHVEERHDLCNLVNDVR